LPSAAVGDKLALYEPIHGSAPDIAGQNKANPLAAIMSIGMLFEHTAKRPELAAAINGAVEDVLNAGARTADIVKPGETVLGTRQMGDAVLKAVERRLEH
ncbi:MAG TPA: isocitrate/isopropylmalate family dehydrogenase, partial [Polyangiales bacterium]